MDNYQIADHFSMLAKLMDIHGENSFKSKSYAAAAFAVEKLTQPLASIPASTLAGIRGIGASAAGKITEMLTTGKLGVLEEIILKTPPGIIEMLNIKGIGPKKIYSIWKEMEIENIGELLYACKENRLKLYKGFGEKTQQNVADSIAFYQRSKGSFLYAQVEDAVLLTYDFLAKILPGNRVQVTGDFARQLEVIHQLEFVIAVEEIALKNAMDSAEGFQLLKQEKNTLTYSLSAGIQVKFYLATADDFTRILVQTSSSPEFYQALTTAHPSVTGQQIGNEEEFFENLGMQTLPAALREDPLLIPLAKQRQVPALIQLADIRGIIHSHSTWSDGNNTIEEMARAAIALGLEYLVVSDHSKSAFYAQGLNEDKIKAQHQNIDELNEKLFPFRIFKSIESDILNDGNLDYTDPVLSSFDLVIASVHSNLKMTEEKAMERLLTAIKNPYTSILGHMTGRLLLSRPGYPLNDEVIAAACLENHVAIELNANPSRLDVDWRHIRHITSNAGLISIDPDAHFISGLKDIKYGVLVAQKAMLTRAQNLSSFSLPEFETYLQERKRLKSI